MKTHLTTTVAAAALTTTALVACEGPPGRSAPPDEIADFLAQNEEFQALVKGQDADPAQTAQNLLDDAESRTALIAAIAQDQDFVSQVAQTLAVDHQNTLQGPPGPGFEAIQRQVFPDDGPRLLSFEKASGDTAVRVLYFDHFGAQGSGTCRWEIRFNGQPCALPSPIEILVDASADNTQRRGTLAGGYCAQIPSGPLSAGRVEISVEFDAAEGDPTCATAGPTAFLEAYEVSP